MCSAVQLNWCSVQGLGPCFGAEVNLDVRIILVITVCYSTVLYCTAMGSARAENHFHWQCIVLHLTALCMVHSQCLVNMLQCIAVQCSVVQCSAVHCIAVQSSAEQCSAVQ